MTTDQTIDQALNQIQQKIEDIPVLCGVVLDRSGSMHGLTQATISGFNEFLQEQKRQPGKLQLFVTMFDSEVEPPVGADVQTVSELDETTYTTQGMTALYDAIGITMDALDKAKQQTGAKKTVLCIITDGQENHSKEYKLDRVKSLIESRQSDGWDVLFLGAGLDVIEQAAQMGVAAGSTASYVASYAGTQSVHDTMSGYVTRSRMAAPDVANFLTDDERKSLTDDDES